ncbi:anti-repressor SinI family protein [Halalkalibacter okhensis]|nr:anti-repressor SinI family protein [Halalkalibacter okhensis]
MKLSNIVLDQEWVRLVAEAKKMGLTMDEIRNFLRSQAVPSVEE